ncbi:3-deoxy-D-manno-octulosonic-acid transferase [Filimonas lacunae]|uniref:3-deoxy-D-manno-octulosonic acid transferase n=1 Tax=Filimonas lacunae TaxID=477680 RepID=A0A173MB09_9BACT|nr:glycosyltransferase N-terminal domain-containing protein [Filimonas lacunae]BAV04671.1 lipid IVA 3-deoxy-D-manno-octulosonic acid transferase [Filimonas lacunae]SIT32424.1 3-deoxy-D-manno-octulosonic-acid transferase [Filimonas lacunae]
MSKLLYRFFISVYPFMARILGAFNAKARLWVNGRKNIFTALQQALQPNTQPVIWMHCASLGEFEQGRPVLEALRLQHPHTRILLTFFSPSGYEVQKQYKGADWIFYLPMDSARNARNFFDIVQPSLVLFVKYEFWHYYLQQARNRNIPLLLVSGIFRSNQAFFKSYGQFHRRMLDCFTHFFVQNQASATLLQSVGYNNITIAGDTRFDRVLEIAGNFSPLPVIEQFCNGKPVIVAGSTWSEDDEELDHFANTHPDIRFIIAPHDIGVERIKECQHLYKQAVLFSEWEKQQNSNANVLIIDNIGMLSRLYHYATICYVGGGFGGDGIHNILEAAVYYKPVVFGPVYDKYFEAVEMLEQEGAFSVPDALHLEKVFDQLLSNAALYTAAADHAGNYVSSKAGATTTLVNYIQVNRLFTN